jgi:hypothetical protein
MKPSNLTPYNFLSSKISPQKPQGKDSVMTANFSGSVGQKTNDLPHERELYMHQVGHLTLLTVFKPGLIIDNLKKVVLVDHTSQAMPAAKQVLR